MHHLSTNVARTGLATLYTLVWALSLLPSTLLPRRAPFVIAFPSTFPIFVLALVLSFGLSFVFATFRATLLALVIGLADVIGFHGGGLIC